MTEHPSLALAEPIRTVADRLAEAMSGKPQPRWRTYKLTTPSGRTQELWMTPERCKEIDRLIADGKLEARSLKAEGRLFYQFLEVPHE